MHLWNEYEGKMLAGYRLGRLLRSEGRNAFFLTGTSEDQSAILRLTESHFDGEELVERWQKIAAISDPGLQGIRFSGQFTLDRVSLACCLLEHTDEILADVLDERVLSSEETREVAKAVSSALAALHSAGLVHEHVAATNVFAAGESIKLRSDCVRECNGDFEADTPEAREALRRGDIRDLGLLLLQCLHLEGQGSVAALQFSPLSRIIKGALDGTINAAGIVAELQVPKAASFQAQRRLSATLEHAASPSNARPESVVTGRPTADATFDAGQPTTVSSTSTGDERNRKPNLRHARIPMRDEGEPRRRGFLQAQLSSRKALLSGAVAVILLGFVFWGATRHEQPASGVTAPRVVNTPAKLQTATANAASARPAALSEGQGTQHARINSRVRTGWYVIAYTYNYEQQAQKKVMHLKRRYVSLQPQVFSPTGRAPYLVALGGPTDSASATAIRDHARRIGLPRDTYARNF